MTGPTEVEKAAADLKAAEDRLTAAMRASTTALILAGFLPTKVAGPRRLAVLREIADQAEEKP